MQLQNISPDWKGSTRVERRIMQKILKHEGTGRAIVHFAKDCNRLSDYWYWYTLGTLWVNYSGWSDLNLWKKLFESSRPNRPTSLMKPDEYAVFQRLPDVVRAYRAHRPNETAWLSYTVDPRIAARFAVERGVNEVVEYFIPKPYIVALFLRRKEAELLVLDNRKVQRSEVIEVVRGGIFNCPPDSLAH